MSEQPPMTLPKANESPRQQVIALLLDKSHLHNEDELKELLNRSGLSVITTHINWHRAPAVYIPDVVTKLESLEIRIRNSTGKMVVTNAMVAFLESLLNSKDNLVGLQTKEKIQQLLVFYQQIEDNFSHYLYQSVSFTSPRRTLWLQTIIVLLLLLNMGALVYLFISLGAWPLEKKLNDNAQVFPTFPVTQGVIGAPSGDYLVNDTNPGIAYTGKWFYIPHHGYGEYQDDLHQTTKQDDSFTYSFVGTGIVFLTERNFDHGDIYVYIDDTQYLTVEARPQGITPMSFTVVEGLPRGKHTIKGMLVSEGYMVVDGFEVTP